MSVRCNSEERPTASTERPGRALERYCGVSAEVEQLLESLGTSLTKTKGETLFQQGDEPQGIFLVKSGSAVLRLCNGSEAVSFRRAVGPGSVLGLPSVLGKQPCSVTATVTRDAEVTFIPAKSMVALFRDNAPACIEALRALSQEVATMRTLAAEHKRRAVSKRR